MYKREWTGLQNIKGIGMAKKVKKQESFKQQIHYSMLFANCNKI